MPYENMYNIDDHKLIKLVKERPELWNPLNVRYSDPLPKIKSWNEIGEILGVEPPLCKNRWINIRDNYRRALKKSLTSDVTCGYKLDKELDFVKTTILERQQKFAKLVSSIGSVAAGTDDSNYQNSPEPSNIPSTSTIASIIEKRKRVVPKQSIQMAETSSSQPKRARYVQDNKDNSDAIDAFLAGLAPTLKSLTPYYLNLAKSKIFMIVQKYEMQMLLKNESREVNQEFHSVNYNEYFVEHDENDHKDILDIDDNDVIEIKPFDHSNKNTDDDDDDEFTN